MKRFLVLTLCLAVALMFTGTAFAADQAKDTTTTDTKTTTEKAACDKDAKGSCPVKDKSASCTKKDTCTKKDGKTCCAKDKKECKDAPKTEQPAK